MSYPGGKAGREKGYGGKEKCKSKDWMVRWRVRVSRAGRWLELRAYLHATGKVREEASSATLKLDYIMSVMVSH